MTATPLAHPRLGPVHTMIAAPMPPPLPRWLDDDARVHRVVNAKRALSPSPQFWPRFVVLGQLGVAIAGGRADDELCLARAARLAPWDPQRPGPLWDMAWREPRIRDDVAFCVAVLATVLDDPRPTSPRELAIIADEFAITLWVLRHVHADRRARHVTR
jgi:hypothetical protein